MKEMKKNPKVVDLQKYRQQKEFDDEEFLIVELICVKCLYRWYGFLPKINVLRDLECPECKAVGTIISTGQLFQKSFADKAFAALGSVIKEIENGENVSVDLNNDESE